MNHFTQTILENFTLFKSVVKVSFVIEVNMDPKFSKVNSGAFLYAKGPFTNYVDKIR